MRLKLCRPLGIIAGVLIASCSPLAETSRLPSADSPELPDPLSSGIVQARALSAKEQRLIDTIAGMFPGVRGDDLRRRLSDQRVQGVRLTAHPAAQVFVDSLMAIREADARVTSTSDASSRAHIAMATLAIADEWTPDLGDAVVIMRASRPGNHIILLPPAATAANVAGAMRALSNMASRGTSPSANARLVITNAKLPAHWQRNGTARFVEALLAGTRERPLTDSIGIGRVRLSERPVSLSRTLAKN